MVRVNLLALTGAISLLSTATLAADLPPPLPPPMVRAPVVETGGWYLRGDVGVGMQRFKSFDFTQTNSATAGPWPATWSIDQKDIKDTFMVGFGVGYAWNNWARFDFTGEYRADVKFKAIGSYVNFPNPTLGRASDFYDGDHRAAVLLANFYVDLGTWWCITPFIGVGAGGAYHTTAALSDIGINTNGLGASAWGYAQNSASNWSFAWAAHAGLAYNVNERFKVEFSYRYLNMGNAKTAEVICGATGCGTGGGPRAYYTLTGMDSHDLRIGLRWMLVPEQPMYAPPIMRKG
jgi:opacity protein-like surface antigen